MKKFSKNIATLVLFSLALNMGFNADMVSNASAATSTQQQKAKEAAKKQKQKEAEKKKKAQQKAKEQAAKQKAKEQAAKQKAKDQAAQQKAKEQTAQPVRPTREEAYQLKVEEIEKYNAYVARYMSRDITHRVGLWGQIGYSNLLPSGINYNTSDAIGFNINSKGGVGGGGGVGYQMRYKRLLVTTGLEMQVYSSLYELSTGAKGVVSRAFDMQPYNGELQYVYSFANSQDKLVAGYLQLPVLLGMEFANRRAYFLAGPKVGIGVIGTSNISGNLTTSVVDYLAIDPYQNMPSHALVSNVPFTTSSKMHWGMNLAMYGEIGMSLDPYIKVNSISTRLAVFAEYGVLNIQQSSNLAGNNDQPVDYSRVLDGGNLTQDLAMVPSLSTTTAASAKVNPLLVGVKATCWFNLPRKQLRPKTLPKEPLPSLKAQVLDDNTNNALLGAVVTLKTDSREPVSKTTNGKGLVVALLPKGDYTITASKMGYYDDSITYSLTRDMRDTLTLRLRPEPKPLVYTLAGRVFAGDTYAPLEAEIQVASMAGKALYVGSTTDEGLFVSNLLAGSYLAQVRCPGFMPLDDTIQFSKDTLSFYMTRIKEGVKVKINNLYFATNRTYILPQSEGALQNLAQFLLDNQSVRIRIIGHTDNVGSDMANQTLSEGRANSLRTELIKRGIDASRIEAEGKGENEPVATNDTEEGRAQNRRVEFMIIDTGNADIQQIH